MAEQVEDLLQSLATVVEQAAEASLLLSTGVKLRHAALYQEVVKAYGSWEAALAALLLHYRDRDKMAALQASIAPGESAGPSLPSREADPMAQASLLGLTLDGELFRVDGTTLPLSLSPQSLDSPEGIGRFCWLGEPDMSEDLYAISKRGLYYGVMGGLVPALSAETPRLLKTWLGLDTEDGIFAVIPRSRLLNGGARLMHVTRGGKAKATQAKDFSVVSGKNGREAFLVNEGDLPIALLFGDELNSVFCASARGQGIHFWGKDVRSMGRKSVGVNVMKLEGNDDTVVSAFHSDGVEQLVVITAQGYGKRLAMSEFRRQGRGGAGMQVARLNAGDQIVAVLPVTLDQDLALFTTLGAIYRLPVPLFQEMGRSARGKKVIELTAGDAIAEVCVLPCAGNLPIALEEASAQEQGAEAESPGKQSPEAQPAASDPSGDNALTDPAAETAGEA